MTEEQEKRLIEQNFDPYKWDETVIVYSKTQNVPVMRGSNGYVATNIGDTIVRVNGKILFPSATPAASAGDSVSAIGNLGELFKGQQIQVQFDKPAGALPRVEIMQKCYIQFE